VEEVLRTHRFSREEYYQMEESGIFQDKRVELIEGIIFDMAPQKSLHYQTIEKVAEVLMKAFGENHWVRHQGPLRLPDDTEPEPDITVVIGRRENYHEHPNAALLVVEISDSTLKFDRGKKARIYARAGITDYWIINLTEGCVEVMRDPAVDMTSAREFRYGTRSIFKKDERVSPLARGVEIAVADLLP
jgi:Uma2 family endonuclease